MSPHVQYPPLHTAACPLLGLRSATSAAHPTLRSPAPTRDDGREATRKSPRASRALSSAKPADESRPPEPLSVHRPGPLREGRGADDLEAAPRGVEHPLLVWPARSATFTSGEVVRLEPTRSSRCQDPSSAHLDEADNEAMSPRPSAGHRQRRATRSIGFALAEAIWRVRCAPGPRSHPTAGRRRRRSFDRSDCAARPAGSIDSPRREGAATRRRETTMAKKRL